RRTRTSFCTTSIARGGRCDLTLAFRERRQSALAERLGSCTQKSAAIQFTPMKPTVYVETTVPSYLTAWPNRDVVRAGEQQVTQDWWAQRSAFELRVSSLVLLECGAGDPDAAALR